MDLHFTKNKNMKKFTEIGQFRNVVKAVKSHHDYQGKDENGDTIYSHNSP